MTCVCRRETRLTLVELARARLGARPIGRRTRQLCTACQRFRATLLARVTHDTRSRQHFTFCRASIDDDYETVNSTAASEIGTYRASPISIPSRRKSWILLDTNERGSSVPFFPRSLSSRYYFLYWKIISISS